jgi:hypothetical protein
MQFVETKQFHLQQGQAEKQKKTKRIACGYPGCQKHIYWMVAVDRGIAIYVPIVIIQF